MKPCFGTKFDNESQLGAASTENENEKIWVFLSKIKENITKEVVREYVIKEHNLYGSAHLNVIYFLLFHGGQFVSHMPLSQGSTPN